MVDFSYNHSRSLVYFMVDLQWQQQKQDFLIGFGFFGF
jgi:hypothetical protein